MNEQEVKDAEICVELLANLKFEDYIEMLERWLKKETKLYLNYSNKSVTPSREEAERRVFKGGLVMLQKIIDKPQKLKERLKVFRAKPMEGKNERTSKRRNYY